MTDQLAPEATTIFPPQSAYGIVPPAAAPAPPPAAAPRTPARPARMRTSSLRVALIWGTLALVAVLIFIFQNTSAVSINFLGAHLQVSLAVAMLLAAVAGALIMTAWGTARITRLRQNIRRELRKSRTA